MSNEDENGWVTDTIPVVSSPVGTATELASPPRTERIRTRIIERETLKALRTVLPQAREDILLEVIRASTFVSLRAGQDLFKAGDDGNAMYVLVWGRLRQTVERPHGTHALPDVHAGQLVGEFAVLTENPRSATVTARRDSHLLEIDRSCLNDLCEQVPTFGLDLARDMARRIGRAQVGPPVEEARAQVITIVPADRSDAYLELAEELRRCLGPSSHVLCDTSATFEARYRHLYRAPQDIEGDTLVSAVLASQERGYQYVLYITDRDDSAWSARALRQADRIFFVARGDSDPHQDHPLEHRARCDAPHTPRSLVLVHDPDVEHPTGTIRWLREGRFAEHYHTKPCDSAPLRRLVRRINGEAIGLVLSGGGARGYAHLGVWRALEELGVPIDYFGGTSVGALLAAAFAIPTDYAGCVDALRKMATPDKIYDQTLPLVSFMASRKLNRVLKEFFGDRTIEDLWVPLFCISADLSSAEIAVHDRGFLWKAVRSSIAIPGVFAPVVDRQRVLVDGGLMDNFPVEEMRSRCQSDRIIAVDVVSHKLRGREYDDTVAVSGWKLLLHRLLPFLKPRKVPGIVGTLLRCLEVNSIRRSASQQTQAQLLLQPDARSVGMLDFEDLETAPLIGYEAAKERILEWVEAEHLTMLSHPPVTRPLTPKPFDPLIL